MRVKSASLAGGRADGGRCGARDARGASPAALAAALASLALAGCASHPALTHPPGTPTSRSSGESALVPPAQPAPTDPATLIIESATAMLGQPYRFGGAAPGGFDCSGLVRYAARSAGLDLPRTAREQLATGTRIARREIEPGDLVFMRLARKELHVGIALGNGRFIHAPATGGRVRIDSLADAPYFGGFIGARRVMGAAGRADHRHPSSTIKRNPA